MTRRQFHSLAGVAALQPRAPRPNILFILSDDHTAYAMRCYGDAVIRTPNLDHFASEGMLFERAFQAAPQCVPSRSALMTGRSPVAVRMGRFNSPLPPDVTTLPEILRTHGYFTGVCRRLFHLDGPARPGPVMQAVYDQHGMVTWDRRVDFLDRNSPRARTQAVVNAFFDKLPRGKPFFLWVNFNDPHHQWDKDAVTPPYDPASIPVPKHLPDLPGIREDLARYYGEITRMDQEFQLVLDTVKARGFANNTIVVFMGDNGMAFPHGKGSLYDPGLNVPLIVRWTGRVRAGTRTRELVSGEDIAPTLLAAAGIRAPKEMSGVSFLPALEERPHRDRKHIFAARLHHGNATFNENTKASGFDLSRCARSDRYKLIYNCTPHQEYAPVDSARDPGWTQMVAAHASGKLAPEIDRAYFARPRPVFELYDLDADPAELNNLAGKPEVAQVEQELKVALYEKMIRDYDFLPLPMVE